MYLVINEYGGVFKLDSLDGRIQQQILDGEIDVIDCETMKISNGYGFDDIGGWHDHKDSQPAKK